MKKIVIETSTNFDELAIEHGIAYISDFDITEELRRHEQTKEEFWKIESWDYDNGVLEVFLED